jgi:hypothetical protein
LCLLGHQHRLCGQLFRICDVGGQDELPLGLQGCTDGGWPSSSPGPTSRVPLDRFPVASGTEAHPSSTQGRCLTRKRGIH